VHQFIEAQRRATNALGETHPTYSDPARNVERIDITEDQGRNGLIDPKMGKRRMSRAILEDIGLEGSGLGQADQQAWTKEMTKEVSELDLASVSLAAAAQEEVRSRTL
jgi:hypothetical protein